jgi:hypothetical protein
VNTHETLQAIELLCLSILDMNLLDLKNLTPAERATFIFIAEAKEIRPRSLPNKTMIGAVSTLKNKGLVKIYTTYTSLSRRKKKKLVRIVSKPDGNEAGGGTTS